MRQNTLPLLAVLIFVVILAACGTFAHQVRAAVAPSCPVIQAGTVSGTIDEYGNTILLIDYPCPFSGLPVLMVSPADSQGTLVVTRFSANGLTVSEGSVQIEGTPGERVRFSWIATLPSKESSK